MKEILEKHIRHGGQIARIWMDKPRIQINGRLCMSCIPGFRWALYPWNIFRNPMKDNMINFIEFNTGEIKTRRKQGYTLIIELYGRSWG